MELNYKNNSLSFMNSIIKSNKNVSYFDVKKIYFDGSQKLPCDFVLGDLISSGTSSGLIYNVKCSNNSSGNAKFILKQIKYKNSELVPEFYNEIKIHNIASKFDMTDPIIFHYNLTNTKEDYTECGYIMKKYKVSLGQYLKQLELDTEHENRDITKEEMKKIRDYFYQLMEIFNRLEDAKIIHNDLHLENLMIDENDNLRIIDFGKSKIFEDIKDLHLFRQKHYVELDEIIEFTKEYNFNNENLYDIVYDIIDN